MRQRLGVAAALLGDPPVLILDEPFNGMDPEGIVWMRGFLRSLATEGRALLVSSHLMSELQDCATHLVVIGRGRLVADTSVAEIIAAASDGRVSLRTTARSEAATVLVSAGATVAVTGPDTLTISGLPSGRVVALLTDGAVPFSEVSTHQATLEEGYMELRETRWSTGPQHMVRWSYDDCDPIPFPAASRTATGSSSCCTPSGPSSGRSGAG